MLRFKCMYVNFKIFNSRRSPDIALRYVVDIFNKDVIPYVFKDSLRKRKWKKKTCYRFTITKHVFREGGIARASNAACFVHC